jgi:alpha-amylase/alpha-mannosidase (GH57 family)
MATDEDILARSLHRKLDAAARARPYELATRSGPVRVLFRDHALSDLVGFTYQSWDAATAAADFVQRARQVAHAARASDPTAAPVVTVILDGENAWEHYAGGGRPFLRALYAALAATPELQPVTMEVAAAGPAAPLRSIFAGSWINADFGIWIGHADDRRAWRQLGHARTALDDAVAAGLEPSRADAALAALLAAEGSDWFWWYGDDHSSAHDRELDGLFRHHLQRAYDALGQAAPDELKTSNISTRVPGATFAPGAVSVDDRGPESELNRLGAAGLEAGVSTMHEVSGHPEAHALIGMTPAGLAVWVDAAGPLDPWTFESRRLDGSTIDGWAARPLSADFRVSWIDLGARPGDRVGVRLVARDRAGHVVRTVPADGAERIVAVPGSGAARRPWSA